MDDSATQMQICSKCGARQRDPQARSCPICGALMPAAAAARRRTIILLGLGLVLAILVALLAIRPVREALLGSSRSATQARAATPAPLQPTALPAISPTASRAPATLSSAPTLVPTVITATASPMPPTATPQPSHTPSVTPTLPPHGQLDRPAGSLDLRSGPDTAYAPVSGVQNGASLEIVARNAAGDWLLVRTADGIGGWVPTIFVHTDGSLLSVPTSLAPPRPTKARPSPTITRTPLPPSPTPQPGPNPRFRTDKVSIQGGDCATLRWDVEGIRAVYLDGNPQGGHGVVTVCPAASHTFVLTVVLTDSQRVDWPLAIEVSGTGAPPQFVIEYKECLPHDLYVGQVKGRVYDRNGRIIVGALVEILVEGRPNIVPVGQTNQDGWYEFNLRSGHAATFVRLEIDGQNVSFYPQDYTVKARSRCYQRVDFHQR
jgi:hypothetical protein